MALLAAKKKLKTKALVNMGRRFKESVCQIPVVEDLSEEDKNQIGELRSTRLGVSTIKRLMMMIILISSILLPMLSTRS